MQSGVQTDSKRDNLFLTELPETVRSWTNTCLAKEWIGAEAALVCWRDAAITVAAYGSALSTPLREQLYQLQLAWAQRVAQLQSLATGDTDPHARTTAPSNVSAAHGGLTATSHIPTTKIPIPRRKAEVQHARKLVAGQAPRATAPPLKKRKKTTAISKRNNKAEKSAEVRQVKVVPAASVGNPGRLKKQPNKKAALRPVGNETSSPESARKAEIRAIREELKLIAKKLNCCT
jgi:hypothetical protein